jgi:hypothetical protein
MLDPKDYDWVEGWWSVSWLVIPMILLFVFAFVAYWWEWCKREKQVRRWRHRRP